MKKTIITLGIVAAIAVTSCISFAAESITLVGGSTSIASVINPIKAPFEKATGITLNATALGSKMALQKLDAGEAEVATAGHTFDELMGVIKKDNVKLKNPVDSLKSVQLSHPALYKVIVNPANPVSMLSKEQLEGIFTGKISNWKDVGGTDAPILCVVSNLSPGSNEVFAKTFLGGKKISIDTLDASNAADLRQNIASNPDAIGYLPAALIDASVKGVESIAMKSQPIILLTIGAPSAKVQKLIDFIKAEGPKYIK